MAANLNRTSGSEPFNEQGEPIVQEPDAQTGHGNFASLVRRHAHRAPDRVALVIPRAGSSAELTEAEVLSFGQLIDRADELAVGLRHHGLRSGDRVVLLLPLCGDLYALVLALFGSGLTAVFIDPAMGGRRLREALGAVRPRAIVSVDALFRYRFFLPSLWRIRRRFSRDSRGPGLHGFAELEGRKGTSVLVVRGDEDEALITFTAGSTGRPKGVNRTHGLLTAQHLALREHFPDRPGEVVMPSFPVVVLHNLCCGMTSVMPEAEPGRILAQMATWKVSTLCAAPALLRRLLRHLAQAGDRVPVTSLRRIIAGGAPVSPALCRAVLTAFPKAAGQVIYGSTEAEPIAGTAMEEVAKAGRGFLVGRPARSTEVALAELGSASRGPLPSVLGEDGLDPYRVAPGEIGEVLVRGPHVNRGYVGDPAAERATKLRSHDGSVWHRTGDLARCDEHGRLWLVGRLPDAVRHRGKILHPLLVEAAIEEISGVEAAALVAHRRAPEGELALVPAPGAPPEVRRKVVAELARQDLSTLPVKVLERIPMEPRYHSKIDRTCLRRKLQKAAGWRKARGA
ncbi:MAG: AMP-binding protein [bacterium]|nr:AMP-binding protein [bacterium]